MMWFFAILVVLVMGGVAAVAAGRGAPMSEAYDDRPDALVPADGPLRGRATCAGCGSRWPSAATGCPRSTPCSTGWPASSSGEDRPRSRATPMSQVKATLPTRPRSGRLVATTRRRRAHFAPCRCP